MSKLADSLVIIGASGHGRIALDIARAAGWTVDGFIDSAFVPGDEIDGAPVLSVGPAAYLPLAKGQRAWFIGIGDNATRARLMEETQSLTGRPAATLIHPSAIISPLVKIESGVLIAAGTVVCTGSRLGNGVIINTGATLDHDADVGDWVKISPGCHLAGAVTLEAAASIGTGASIIPGIRVGEGSVVGAGSVVIRDIPAQVVAYGNPARVKRDL